MITCWQFVYQATIREKGSGQRHSNITRTSLKWKPIFRIWVAPTQYLLSEDFHQSHINGRVLWVIFQPSANLIMFFIITLHHHQHGESCIRGQGLNNFLRASILRRTSARSISQAITFVIHTICMMELWTCYHVHICCLGVVPIEF